MVSRWMPLVSILWVAPSRRRSKWRMLVCVSSSRSCSFSPRHTSADQYARSSVLRVQEGLRIERRIVIGIPSRSMMRLVILYGAPDRRRPLQELCDRSDFNRLRIVIAWAAYSLIQRSCTRLIGRELSRFHRSRPSRLTMIRSASSSTFRCCMTVQRSKSANISHNMPVVRGSSFSRSRIARRRGWASALKIRSSVSLLDMLYLYNILWFQARGDRL